MEEQFQNFINLRGMAYNDLKDDGHFDKEGKDTTTK